MNNSELVDILKSRMFLSAKEARIFCDTFFGAIMESLGRGDRVEIRGFGSFTVKEYKAYTGRNPKTGEKITVPPKKLPFFRVGKELKKIVDK
ncbi:MAG: integration host factor subunit beta [Desulfobacterales bacterium]|nr:integration host factor subunit beta [Desulfobacterales bacterium]